MAYILAIESSCDDTSAAVLKNNLVLSNFIANQKVHEIYGGVVPELASRAHMQNIVPVVDAAIKQAQIKKTDLDVIAYTGGPGLLGSLLVGVSFSKAMGKALQIPIIEVNHLEAHVLSHFIKKEETDSCPEFPYLCLLVSGGHTQIIKVNSAFDFEIIGSTIDDAAGEAIDKAAKIMNLPYPGGPVIDRLAKAGNPKAFRFSEPRITGLDYSFSGIKTSILYFVRDQLKLQSDFIEKNLSDLCASVQYCIISSLMKKLIEASKQTGIQQIAIGGGVSANSLLREKIKEGEKKYGWTVFIPPLQYTTDNAAMVGIAGLFKYQKGIFAQEDATPYTRSK